MICFSGGNYLSFLYSKSPKALDKLRFPLILPPSTKINQKMNSFYYHIHQHLALFCFLLATRAYDLWKGQWIPNINKIT